MWVNKFRDQTVMTASFPDNPLARDSVAAYLEAMRSV
jgi:mycolipenoyl-CoA---2-(long-chain-fatty acyl)-trehalose mycolipenoyltransferase / long-chain-acyl-CoA---trehalose acyltransferase